MLHNKLFQHALSRFAGQLANSQTPWFKNLLIRYFLSRYAVGMDEAVQSDPYQYPHFNAFFTRRLRPETRPITQGLYDLASPVDGTVSQYGSIKNAELIQAKGHFYRLTDLLGSTAMHTAQSPFAEGSFITLYLAPHNYHRVHMPFEGSLYDTRYIPGTLFSVDGKTSASIPGLFARNERVVSYFQTTQGSMAVIFVGAMIVGSISTAWAGSTRNHTSIHSTSLDPTTRARTFTRGEELGFFELGSTVILLFEDPAIAWEANIHCGQTVRVGQKMGSFDFA